MPMPVDHVFVIDTSSSMHGDRINGVLDGMQYMTGKMRSDDTVTIFTFEGSSVTIVLDGKRPGDINWEDVKSAVKTGGYTNMFDAIISAMDYIWQGRGRMPHHMRHKRAVWTYCMTDGDDNNSNTTLEEVAERMNKPGIINFNFVMILYGTDAIEMYSDKLCRPEHAHVVIGGPSAGSDVVGIADMFRKVNTIVVKGRSVVFNEATS